MGKENSNLNSNSNSNSNFEKVFLLDREFDNQKIIEHLCRHKEKPKFIIRAKHLDRIVKEGQINKLSFGRSISFNIKELQIKQKKYQNVKLKLSHRKITLINEYKEETEITIIKTNLINSDKQPTFKDKSDCFYLLTNQEITTKEDLYQAYLNYFIRWKIETVFKFLKEVLGMEEFRVEGLKEIKNVIALTFLVGSYLNDLDAKNIQISEEFLIILSKLGDGEITKYYLKKGLQALVEYLKVQIFFKQEDIPIEKQEGLLNMVRLGGKF